MSVKTSGDVLSSDRPSLIHTTLNTGPPVELHVRENVTLSEFWDDIDVSLNEFKFVSGTISATAMHSNQSHDNNMQNIKLV